MARIANSPVTIPSGVEINLEKSGSGNISVKGSKGFLEMIVRPEVEVRQEDGVLLFAPRKGDKLSRALAGTTRALLDNMVQGVTEGFVKKLNLTGVGYRVQVKGKTVSFNLGYSHPINYNLPEGVTAEAPNATELVVKGIDKQVVGQVAAEMRDFRRPEPYKGKGVSYANERIRRKEAKKK